MTDICPAAERVGKELRELYSKMIKRESKWEEGAFTKIATVPRRELTRLYFSAPLPERQRPATVPEAGLVS